MTITKPEVSAKSVEATRKPVILFHGDKGGVGKSWTCALVGDYLLQAGVSVAIVDGDSRNPDISRMFDTFVPVTTVNLRNHEGWMDAMDFVIDQPDSVVLVSMPAGAGEQFEREAPQFVNTLRMLKRSLSMFWVTDDGADSVNLLNDALSVVGGALQGKVVVRNHGRGTGNMQGAWNGSNTRTHFEKDGGLTVELTKLHDRARVKMFSNPDKAIPFSKALVGLGEASNSPHKLTPSENMELHSWVGVNHKMVEGLRSTLGI